MGRVALVIEYDGTAYAGWQRQPHAPTVQGALEDTLARITQAPCPVTAAGRTDAGVHAVGQVAHLDTGTRLGPEALRDALNALLPPDIVVRRALQVAADFHARRDARWRVYRYVVLSRAQPSAFLRRYVHHVPGGLRLEPMRAGAQALLGRHDFAAFRVAGTATSSTVCEMHAVRIEARGDLVIFTVAADRFLRQMVRRVVGSLLWVGQGALPPDAIGAILRSADNAQAAPPAPAHGLYLAHVEYAPGRLDRAAGSQAGRNGRGEPGAQRRSQML
ncbi:MAG: tRNA pseudouridine(38-40) synthase TruA [Firmicutes bacterium]|nr:tRNA pseudouridine(38-40) synthase TruA [Bacillota bacterium]